MNARRVIAVGAIRHRSGRTTILTATAAGVTGRITPRPHAGWDPDDGDPAPAPQPDEQPQPIAA